ncbi:MAG: glycine cleavage system aminomethyltransferase GcvT [Granulosicoccus sp.]
MGIKTALHQVHVDNAAKLVDFSGYSMPLHYGSLLSEHQSVRDSAGMFDVSHMCILDVHGHQATSWLRLMLTNDVAKLVDGKAMYTCLCLENGGVVDDLMVFRMDENHYRLYVDAARREKDLAWMNAHLVPDVEISEVEDKSIIAVQGPDAITFASAALDSMGLPLRLNAMPRFSAITSGQWFVSRTGYTGEDGVEIAMPSNQAVGLWQALSEQGVSPAGLGARDTLRLEAGFSLYGPDIDENHSPAESGIANTIDIRDEDRAFIGREILEDHKLFGGRFFQVGLTLNGDGMLRRGAAVELVGQSIGKITSGRFSPTRATSVALARVSRKFTGTCDVSVRDRLQPASIASVPFVPHGLARE